MATSHRHQHRGAEDNPFTGGIVRWCRSHLCREPDLLQGHRGAILAGAVLCGIEAGLILALFAHLLRRRRTEASLRENEERTRLAADVANCGIWIRSLDGDEVWATQKWRELFGFTSTEPLNLNRFFERLHPDDRDAVSQVLEEARQSGGSYARAYRIILPDGHMRWIASQGHVAFNRKGKPASMQGVSIDYSARRVAEEAARDLSGRLIHAQEEVHRRLARELHDALSQSLALLSVELEMFGQKPPCEPERIAARMQDFSSQVRDLSSEVHRLSHELHPAKLDQLGLEAAVRGFCKEFALAHEIAVEFAARNAPFRVPADAALCLYRIAQEALHNVVRHSGATAAKVDLARGGRELRLVVADDGVGFDPQAEESRTSLGLVSMNERARFVHGRLSIDSRPGAGTRVELRVPIVESGESSTNPGTDIQPDDNLIFHVWNE